ncbi:hypothetical protein, partial [Variovorax sp. CF313]|uniref:hypothetical protein n=1 Tax=Variovorax sp. CF313 TaxID=1144315 RepID=UPI001ED93709
RPKRVTMPARWRRAPLSVSIATVELQCLAQGRLDRDAALHGWRLHGIGKITGDATNVVAMA